jgi:ATP-dependent helicase/nuclease subunit A
MQRPVDYHARDKALQLSHSCLVQAPAGSGKTYLLISRYLKALATIIESPEEVIAITFTNKAAQEMRHRLLTLLQQGATLTENAEQEQRYLAQQAYQHVLKLGIDLLSSPQYITIMTIDSWCNRLLENSPLSVTPYPHALYEAAIDHLLADYATASWKDILITLLDQVHNRYQRLADLLIELLAMRDIWLPFILAQDKPHDLLMTLEQALSKRSSQLVAYAAKLTPSEHIPTIDSCLAIYLAHLEAKPIRLDSQTLTQRSVQQHLAELLLTKSGTLRKSVNSALGFPPASGSKHAEEKAQLQENKSMMQGLLAALQSYPEWIAALNMVRYAPPDHYIQSDRAILEPIIQIMPIAVAYLQLTFQRHQQADFTEIALQAQAALGKPDEPTELGLYWSEKLRHILVDEFQDTSVSQLRLLEQLTITWEPDQEKSLFLVGDPMQSIYRFRQADVGIFTSLIHGKLGHIPLQYIALTSNFRSSAPIVNWVNHLFAAAFSGTGIPHSGSVPFHHAVATKEGSAPPIEVTLVPAEGLASEHAAIVRTIIDLRKRSQGSIAILAGVRRHIHAIADLLHAHQIPTAAEAMQALHQVSDIIDIVSLSLALQNVLDKTSWLAVLRTPWIGLSTEAIYMLANHQPATCVFDSLLSPPDSLPADCAARLQYLTPILQEAVAQVGRINPIVLLEKTWLQLGGPYQLNHPALERTIEKLFTTLSTIPLPRSWQQWQTFLATQYMEAPPQDENPVHLLTIHKAKGLEFDHVILPALAELPRSNSTQLLNWQCSYGEGGNVILSPIPKESNAASKLHAYMKTIDTMQNHHERLRVLYVAATRAKTSLHLFAQATKDSPPSPRTFLGMLWPLLDTAPATTVRWVDDTPTPAVHPSGTTHRLALSTLALLSSAFSQHPIVEKEPTTLSIETDRIIIGNLVHLLLERIANRREDITDISPQDILYDLPLWIAETTLPATQYPAAQQEIETIIQRCLACPTLQTILCPSHHAAQNEYAVTTACHGEVKRYIIDRTYIDQQNRRWIIDYKTSLSPQERPPRYEQQLNQYATLFSHAPEEIWLGLYYPISGDFDYWRHERTP